MLKDFTEKTLRLRSYVFVIRTDYNLFVLHLGLKSQSKTHFCDKSKINFIRYLTLQLYLTSYKLKLTFDGDDVAFLLVQQIN